MICKNVNKVKVYYLQTKIASVMLFLSRKIHLVTGWKGGDLGKESSAGALALALGSRGNGTVVVWGGWVKSAGAGAVDVVIGGNARLGGGSSLGGRGSRDSGRGSR